MRRIKAREYARAHKISLFEVIRRIQEGRLRGETVQEKGVRVQYVLLDEDETRASSSQATRVTNDAQQPQEHGSSSEETIAEQLQALRREIALLRQELRRCCGPK